MKKEQEERALSLRRNGNSIKNIAHTLAVSQSTVSRWCADITLTTRQEKRLEQKRRAAGLAALAPWIRKNRQKKQDDIQEQTKRGQHDLGTIRPRDLFMIGLGLYWGEGYKRGSQEWGFTNSDPAIIRTILVWLRRYYGIPRSQIIARLTLNERYEDEQSRITDFWTKESGLDREQFGPPTFIHGHNKQTHREASTYRGTLRIKVRRSTSLRRRVLASINRIDRQLSQ